MPVQKLLFKWQLAIYLCGSYRTYCRPMLEGNPLLPLLLPEKKEETGWK